MNQILYDIALRLGLGLIAGILLLIFVTMLDTAFYNHTKKIHLVVIFALIVLVIYALGDIAVDILRI